MKKLILIASAALALAACQPESQAQPLFVPDTSAPTVTVPETAIRHQAVVQGSIAVRVLSVYDGDTFTIDSQSLGGLMTMLPNLRVRVRNLDTPEKGAQAKCKSEREHALVVARETRRLIAGSGNTVVLSNLDWDKYGGRIDADVTLDDNRDLADVLVKFGHARHYNGGKRKGWCEGGA